jgi:hypothetical protein
MVTRRKSAKHLDSILGLITNLTPQGILYAKQNMYKGVHILPGGPEI